MDALPRSFGRMAGWSIELGTAVGDRAAPSAEADSASGIVERGDGSAVMAGEGGRVERAQRLTPAYPDRPAGHEDAMACEAEDVGGDGRADPE